MSVDQLIWVAVMVVLFGVAVSAAVRVIDRADQVNEPVPYLPCDCDACGMRPDARARVRAFLVERARIEWTPADDAAFRQECAR